MLKGMKAEVGPWLTLTLCKAEQMLEGHLETTQAKQFSGQESQSLTKIYILNGGSLSLQVDIEQCWMFSCHLGVLCLLSDTGNEQALEPGTWQEQIKVTKINESLFLATKAHGIEETKHSRRQAISLKGQSWAKHREEPEN